MAMMFSLFKVILLALGQKFFGLYTEVAFVERLFCTQTVHLGPGRYIYSSWPLFGGSC